MPIKPIVHQVDACCPLSIRCMVQVFEAIFHHVLDSCRILHLLGPQG